MAFLTDTCRVCSLSLDIRCFYLLTPRFKCQTLASVSLTCTRTATNR